MADRERMTRDCQHHTRGTAEPGYCEMLDCECYGDQQIRHCHDATNAEWISLRRALRMRLRDLWEECGGMIDGPVWREHCRLVGWKPKTLEEDKS